MTTVDRIFRLMKKNNLTAKEFANKVGVSQGNITDWKTGRANPSISSLNKIAKSFNISVDYLLGNTDKSSYTETLVRYLKPLGLTEKQFDAFQKIAILFINKEPYANISTVLKKENFNTKELNKVSNALYIVCDLVDDFEKTAKLNKAIYTVSKIGSSHSREMNEDTYDYFMKNMQPEKIARDELTTAINNLNKSLIIDNSNSFYMCPVYGQISAGQPNWAEENIEGRIPIDTNLMDIVNPEDHFFLRVNGESMNKVVKNGAFALIHKQDIVENGEIAVVLVNRF